MLLGGEESGGIGTKLHLPERDATVSALLLAEVMAWHRKSLGEILRELHAEFGEYHYGRVDLELKPGQKEKALEYFANPKLAKHAGFPIVRREEMDGYKAYLGETGWLLVRGSGTEPLLRLYTETPSADTTRRILDATAAIVRAL
jgi:phosphomannomutase